MDIEHKPGGESPELPPGSFQNFDFSFSGKAADYFGIWIVNLLLSLVTLGIYTAWAKVRRLRYFYGNTWLDGHNFEYLAKPKQILIGRIIVVGALLIYNFLVQVSPFFGILIVPYLIAFPWLVNKSMAFNARMTSYRNVRLNFAGSYWGAFKAFVLWPFLALLTLGIMMPFASRASANYIGNNLGYGKSRFQTKTELRAFYAHLGQSFLVLFFVTIVTGLLGMLIGFIAGIKGNVTSGVEFSDTANGLALGMVAGLFGLYSGVAIAYTFYSAGARNITFNSSTLDGTHSFISTLGRWRYAWILISNLLVSLVSLGLMMPWAAVRTWRYLAENTKFIAAGSMDHFIDTTAPEGNVGASEFFDIEGVDFGI